MIKSSKSIPALSLLFLCLFFTSRYLQRVYFEKDLVFSIKKSLKINSKDSGCNPKKNSLIHHYLKGETNALIIVLDAFPNPKVFQSLSGHSSKLHYYLKNNSSESIYVSSASQKTFSSLPFLLGKISPNNNCRYPFFKGNIKPNLLINSKFISTSSGLCPRIYNLNSKNSFIRYKNKIRRLIDKKYVKNLINDEKVCSFKNKEMLSEIINKLKLIDDNKKNGINIIHDVNYHSDPEGRNRINGLGFYDKEYLNGIKFLITALKKSKIIDELIVMNDHGPRILNKPIIEYEGKNFNSLYDDMFYGVFISRFDMANAKNSSKKQKILKDLIPSSKYRFCDNGKGKIIKIESLNILRYCQ